METSCGGSGMSREAMKQPEALLLADALDDEFTKGRISNHNGRKAAVELRRLHEVNQDLLKALHEALETEQEPVAWRTFDGEGGYDYRSYEMNDTYDKEWAERNPNHKGWVEPLYTAPPRKQWVGLTDEEVSYCRYAATFLSWLDTAYMVELIEQALKEKNT